VTTASVSEHLEVELEHRSGTPGDVSLSDCDESRLHEHPLRCDVVVTRSCREPTQSDVVTSNPAKLPQSIGRYPSTRDSLRNSIAHFGCPILNGVEVEAAHHRTVFVDENEESADSGLLVSYEFSMPLCELVKEHVATIADRPAEVRPILPFEDQHCSLVVAAKGLQLEHGPSLFPCRAPECPHRCVPVLCFVPVGSRQRRRASDWSTSSIILGELGALSVGELLGTFRSMLTMSDGQCAGGMQASRVDTSSARKRCDRVAGKCIMRMTTVAAALLLTGGASVVVAGPAAAATGTASCGQVNGTGITGTVTFSSCTDKSNTGGSGTVPESQFGTSASTITWALGHGTTTLSMTWTSSSKTRNCPNGTKYLLVGAGRVVADSGLASSIAVGGEVAVRLCMSGEFALVLKPATRFRL
jgi:hypothetical protein